MTKIINGLEIAEEFCGAIKFRVSELKKAELYPKLVTISVGNNFNGVLYNKRKEDFAKVTGILTEDFRFTEKVTFKELSDLISKLNADKNVHAILLQSPLPKHLSFRDVVNLISPEKDVDGLTTLNQGRLFLREPGIVPCTPLGVLHLLRTVHDNLAGMHAVVIGRSSAVGRPLTQLLLNVNCTVTLLHSYSKDLESICKTADILVSAVGKMNFVNESFIKKGATVIDVGINHIVDEFGREKLSGDVDFDSVANVAGAITPVPNGVAPMTVAYLLHNTVKLACCY